MLFLLCRNVWVSVFCVGGLQEGVSLSGVCVCLGAGELLGLMSRDLAVMR